MASQSGQVTLSLKSGVIQVTPPSSVAITACSAHPSACVSLGGGLRVACYALRITPRNIALVRHAALEHRASHGLGGVRHVMVRVAVRVHRRHRRNVQLVAVIPVSFGGRATLPLTLLRHKHCCSLVIPSGMDPRNLVIPEGVDPRPEGPSKGLVI